MFKIQFAHNRNYIYILHLVIHKMHFTQSDLQMRNITIKSQRYSRYVCAKIIICEYKFEPIHMWYLLYSEPEVCFAIAKSSMLEL